ncbi:hypothetical protein [Ornithinibacillus halophilus]|uniref:Uncharacterized protein n=1 Tax=Ornithinibacillus halophilus TaxID=930117 RepID=A0A1M5NRS6_9BACI|nr:hypothetical protein [Ornithinibacillus halophilus]SHG92251.1 hypothetical protein SAMN05216225_10884 [Ornithinibacillus halophilus]
MRELIGTCQECEKDIYCENGFLNGVHEDGKLLCFECDKKEG